MYNHFVETATIAYAALDREEKKPTLTEQLLVAIMSQLDVISDILDKRLQGAEVEE
jgi:hypothetical protein